MPNIHLNLQKIKAWMRNNSSQILKKKKKHTTESIKNSINRMLFEMASPK